MSSGRIKLGLVSALVRTSISTLMTVLLLAATMVPARAQSSVFPSAAKPQSGEPAAAAGENPKRQPALIFQHGQEALNHGRLNEAERDFRQILALDPQSGAAYA
ncbi:MAG: hypothetical protein WA604_12965, partial [Candidatus Sulfotelmatobacter sp.]